MTISDEACRAAARQLFFQHSNTNGPSLADVWDHSLNDDLKGPFMRDARAALEAAAPFIRAEALEEAADDLDLPGSSASGYYASEQVSGYLEAERHVEAWLCARAAEMRQG